MACRKPRQEKCLAGEKAGALTAADLGSSQSGVFPQQEEDTAEAGDLRPGELSVPARAGPQILQLPRQGSRFRGRWVRLKAHQGGCV